MNRNVPFTADGAQVLAWAPLKSERGVGRTRHVVDGEERRDFAGLLIARYDDEAGFYLFYCDADWEVITDTHHDTIEAAKEQALFEFGEARFEELDLAGEE